MASVLRALVLVSCLALPGLVRARATVQLEYVGDAISDQTPSAPAGGNAGETLGEQRRLALEYAAEVWAARLDSDVPIVVEVEFTPLPCDRSSSVLGAAATTALFSGITSNGADPNLFYPSALANRLAGRDLDPNQPEIQMQLNSDVDAACRDASGGFYYGFDRNGGEGVDFIETVLHELAHGLGLASFADPESGALFMGEVDPYTALVRDLDSDRAWPELGDVGRAASARSVRRVVWDGQRARDAVQMQFAKGTPSLAFEPEVSGFTGAVSDTSFGQSPALFPASGPVVAAEGCEPLQPSAAGSIALLRPTRCPVPVALRNAKDGGVRAALVVVSSPYESPALPADVLTDAIELPIATLSTEDAERLATALGAGGLRASLGGAAEQALGADAQDRPLLFASEPVSASSSISHLDPLIRPQQMMEPITGPIPSHDVTFTLALLADLGWQQGCGDGLLDGDEECDEGAANSDTLPDRCRSQCRRAACGDGVKDSGEACDGDNDDRLPDACRSTCERAQCGDGVVDSGERCDLGTRNSDEPGSSCRTDCSGPACGDGVRDESEACDDGEENSDARPGACRTTCVRARCGDAVVDPGEVCDEGARNSDTQAGACRRDCFPARCGDGVVDPDEACDRTPGCDVDCRAVGSDGGDREPADAGRSGGARDRDAEAPDGGVYGDAQRASCSCRAVRASHGGSRGVLLAAALGLWVITRTLRRGWRKVRRRSAQCGLRS